MVFILKINQFILIKRFNYLKTIVLEYIFLDAVSI